jgi:EAL domain-containing protein (putative c-di-GMP-specific phosphodiesterase class I)/CheY-like chemotaxis protein
LSLAKQKGRNNYQFYSQEYTVAASEKARLENGLRDAIEKGELFLQYQPQVSLFDGRLLGFEALVRWLHPQSGLIPPGKFIALAEQNGLINPLGEWVMRSACQQAREWYDMGLFDGTMAVNVSGIQIQQGDIAALTRTVLAETGLDVKMLELELTESAVMESPEHALTQLNQLKSQGVSLAIDDFGTGHSSLSHLLQFPFDKLKIDRSFVKHVTTNPQDGALVQAIISMGKGMQLKILAEGIETEEQLYYLKGNGCEILQGYYFSAPVDSGQAETLLSERRKLQFSTDVEGSETATLLLVDDEVNVTSTLKRALHKQDYRILVANHAAEALQLMARHRVQVILSDQKMPEILGTELLRKVRYLYPQTIRMILSGESDIETVKEAINSGWIYKFLTKPINHEELKNNINEAFDTYWRFKQDE